MNLFGITSVILFFSALGFGFTIYESDKKSRLNKSWFLLSITIALWGLGLYGVTSTTYKEVAMEWQYLLDVSAIFIPIFFLYFNLELLKIKTYVLYRSSLTLGFLLVALSFTHAFKSGMTIRYGFYWIQPGPLYIIFPIFFVCLVAVSIYLLARSYIRSTDPVIKAQIRNTCIAGLIGFGGGLTDFFPQIINIYPFGNYFVILYVFLMTYGVLKYKLLSTKVISAQLFAGAMVLVFLFDLLKGSSSLSDWFIKFLLLTFVIFFSILLVQGVYREVSQRQKIEALAADLRKANDRLTELDRQKSEFVSFATHQLRAPLTAMKGYASLMLEGDMGVLPAEAKQGIERIYDSTKTLTSIVDDYLNVSRIELGTMKYAFETIDLKTLIEDTIGELKPNIDKSGLAFSFNAENGGTDWRITADRDKLKQVIANVIDNSMKYTPKGSIAVTLTLDKPRHKFVFAVKDTGVGIASETLPRLFQKFSRADNANKVNIRGTGLGLFVAKQMVEAHHGTIRAESAGEGKGSTFIVELDPLAKA